MPICAAYTPEVVRAIPIGHTPNFTNLYECKQNIHVSARNTHLNAGTSWMALNEKLRVWRPKAPRPPSLGTLDIQL